MTDPLSLCPHCNCMTKNIGYQCDKCKAVKDQLTEKRLREFQKLYDSEIRAYVVCGSYSKETVLSGQGFASPKLEQFLIDTIQMVREENKS